MTVVVGLAEPVSSTVILIADSRVTQESQSTATHFDVCQKIARLDNQGLIGISGEIRLASDVARWVTGTYKERGIGWIGSKAEVVGLLDHIGVLGQREKAEFLVAYVDGGVPRLVRFTTDGDYTRTSFGLKMIGAGSEIYDAIRPRLTDIVNFAGPGRGGIAVGQRAFLLSEWVTQEARRRSITSVGGLMQIHFVEAAGVRAIPYRHWVDVDEQHGTYVNMEIDDDGAWVQVHEPSGSRVPLRFPGESDFRSAAGTTSENFELARSLSWDSPGVVARPNPVELYSPVLTEGDRWVVWTG